MGLPKPKTPALPAVAVAATDPYVPPPAMQTNTAIDAERKANRSVASALGANNTILTSPRGVPQPVSLPLRGSLLGT